MGMMFTNSLAYDMHGRKRRVKKSQSETLKKYKPKFKAYVAPPSPPQRDEGVTYASVSDFSTTGQCSRKESPKYTGTLIKGIATMHKSNAVPVMNQEQAAEISAMAK